MTRELTPTVAGVARLPHHLRHFRIHDEWFKTIKFADGKPQLIAMWILADTIRWYQPEEITDPETNLVVEYRRRFEHDLLQRDYDYWEADYGITGSQARRALDCLEGEVGVLRREVRARFEYVDRGGKQQVRFNAMFVDINVKRLWEITVPAVLRDKYTPPSDLQIRPPLICRSDPSDLQIRLHYSTNTLLDPPIAQNAQKQPVTQEAALLGFTSREQWQSNGGAKQRVVQGQQAGLSAAQLVANTDKLAELHALTAVVEVDDSVLRQMQDMAIFFAMQQVNTPEKIMAVYEAWSKEDEFGRKDTRNGTIFAPPRGKQLQNFLSYLVQMRRIDNGNVIASTTPTGGNNTSKQNRKSAERQQLGDHSVAASDNQHLLDMQFDWDEGNDPSSS